VEVAAVAVAVVVEDAVNRDGGTLFGVLSALDNNKQRYIQIIYETLSQTPNTILTRK